MSEEGGWVRRQQVPWQRGRLRLKHASLPVRAVCEVAEIEEGLGCVENGDAVWMTVELGGRGRRRLLICSIVAMASMPTTRK